jgi:predicted RNase H-like nuclease (RuvC/YqgF family)
MTIAKRARRAVSSGTTTPASPESLAQAEDVPRSERERKMASPVPNSGLTRRQEQNRAAQRAFRERRAKFLKNLEDRMTRLENEFRAQFERSSELGMIKDRFEQLEVAFRALKSTVDTLSSFPTWTVPGGPGEETPILMDPQPDVIQGALRPSSTNPILDASDA